jgi:hypothetical protein
MDGIEMQLKYVIVFMTACTKRRGNEDSRIGESIDIKKGIEYGINSQLVRPSRDSVV